MLTPQSHAGQLYWAPGVQPHRAECNVSQRERPDSIRRHRKPTPNERPARVENDVIVRSPRTLSGAPTDTHAHDGGDDPVPEGGVGGKKNITAHTHATRPDRV